MTSSSYPGRYARLLFADLSSAFNTIVPELLHQKLTQFAVPVTTCHRIISFLIDRQQHVRLGSIPSISTGAPQGCVLSPLLYTNDRTSKNPSVKLLKFADDTTAVGLTQDGDESAYRQELVQWCSQNHLEFNPDCRDHSGL